MENSTSLKNIFLIPVSNNFLLYSPFTGISALLNRAGILELLAQYELLHECNGDHESKLFTLAQDLSESSIQSPNRKSGDLNPEFLGIIPTRSCNGACNYCDFGAEKVSSKKMSFKMASNAVDWFAGLIKPQQRDKLEIHFFGGEPMVARDVIEVVVQRAKLIAIEKNLIPFFEISTNGQYSVNDAHFLGRYFNKVVLSFDGFKEVQNRHRPVKANRNSYENAVETATIISNSDAELCIRCCVSQLNVLLMEDFTKWLIEKFKLSAINFEILTPTSQTDAIELFPPDPVDFAIHFQKSRELASEYGIEVVYASDISAYPQVSSCPVGKDAAIISPDGRISNCYLMPDRWQNVGLDLDFGVLKSNGDVQLEIKKVEDIRIMVEDKPRCSNCFCQLSCAGGCHVGITFPGSRLEYDDFCKQTRLISTFTLLSNLGLKKEIVEVMQSPEAILKIINQASDQIQSFKD